MVALDSAGIPAVLAAAAVEGRPGMARSGRRVQAAGTDIRLVDASRSRLVGRRSRALVGMAQAVGLHSLLEMVAKRSRLGLVVERSRLESALTNVLDLNYALPCGTG